MKFGDVGKPFDEFIRDFSYNPQYSTFQNENGTFISVKLKNKNNPIQTVILYFSTTIEGELIFFQLGHMAVSYDDKNWNNVPAYVASILIFSPEKSIFKLSESELKALLNFQLPFSYRTFLESKLKFCGRPTAFETFAKPHSGFGVLVLASVANGFSVCESFIVRNFKARLCPLEICLCKILQHLQVRRENFQAFIFTIFSKVKVSI